MKRPPLPRWVSPAARLSGGVVFAVSLATAPPSGWALCFAGFFFLSVLALAKPPRRRWQRRLALALFGGCVMLVPFALGGEFTRLVPIALRMLTAIVAAVATSLTLGSEELPGAVSAFRAPQALGVVIMHTVAQLGSLADEGQRLALARKLRGAAGTGANVELLSTLLIQSAARAERRALAAELRGPASRPQASSVRGAGSVAFVLICVLMGIGAHWVGR